MLQNLKVRLALIAGLILLSGWFLYRNYERTENIVTLGLDLQGGSHFQLEVDETGKKLAPAQRADAIDRALRVVRMRVDQLGVSEPTVQKAGEDRIIVELAGLAEQNRAKEILQKTAFLEFQIVRPMSELQPILPRMDRAVVAALGARAAGASKTPAAPGVGGLFKTAPADSAAAGAATAQDSLPAAQPISSLFAQAGQAGQLLVDSTKVADMERYLKVPEVQRLLPRGTALLWGVPEAEDAPGFRSLWLVEDEAMVTGEYLEDAQAQTDQFNRPIVVFELNRRGGRLFEKATGENINKQMAIVLDDRVFTAPTIRSQIGSRGQIDLGGAQLEDATDLALVLRAGALPAPLRIVEERSIGASLGADSVDKGMMAGLIGIGLVVGMILLYYKGAGIFAVLGLSIYVLFILGSLAMLDATLTLPGIAGLILSIGMAVDANVLIFERIREELAAGRPVRLAVNEGFRNALSAIVDSNLTTLITAGILFYVGTGPIRGFAVTLAVGIVASMFTAIFVTRTFFLLYLERRSPAQQGLSI